MHRGSSKGAREARAPETLPLSALPLLSVEVEVARGAAGAVRTVEVAPGTTVRELLRSLGRSPEGCAVLEGDRPLPSDTPLQHACRLTVVPTFSGG